MIIGKMSVDTRFRDRSARPIRHRQDDRETNSCDVRPRELQIMHRYILGGISEEDLVILLYFLLASTHLSGQEVEAYEPEILALRRLVADGRDKEIIEFLIKSSKGIYFVNFEAGNNYFLKNHLPVETEFGGFVGVVQCRGASWPHTGVLIIVGSVAMMSSSGARRDPVATSGDGTFENCLGLALDAQIDRGLCCMQLGQPKILSHSEKEKNACFRPGTSWLVPSLSWLRRG